MGDDDLGLIEAFQKQGLLMHKPSALTPRRGLFSRSSTGTSIVFGLVSLQSTWCKVHLPSDDNTQAYSACEAFTRLNGAFPLCSLIILYMTFYANAMIRQQHPTHQDVKARYTGGKRAEACWQCRTPTCHDLNGQRDGEGFEYLPRSSVAEACVRTCERKEQSE